MRRRRRSNVSADTNVRDDDLDSYSYSSYDIYTINSLRMRNITNNAHRAAAGKRNNLPHKARPNTKAIFINFITVVISAVGLIGLVIGYCCLGGAVFAWLEADTENETIRNARVEVEAFVKQYAAILYTQLQLNTANQSIDRVRAITDVLDDVSDYAYQLAINDTWDGEPQGSGITLDWTLPGAILFSVTTITTIGFGFITPKTDTGKIICIFYSVFGIPITMLAIANLGLWFANQVRKVHKAVAKLRRRDIDDSHVAEVPVVISLVIMVGYILGGAALFSRWEDNFTFIDGAYFCFITLTTIGFGDMVPGVYTGKGDWITEEDEIQSGGTALKLIICGVYLFFGLSLLAMCMDLMKEEVRANFLWLGYRTSLMTQKSPEEVIEEYIAQQTGG